MEENKFPKKWLSRMSNWTINYIDFLLRYIDIYV